MKYPTFQVLSVKISDVSYNDMINVIDSSITAKERTLITYANAATCNLAFSSLKFARILDQYDLVHPDGTGVFLAARFLNTETAPKRRITGSDFYPILIQKAIEMRCRVYILGDRKNTLDRISIMYPDLQVVGLSEGFNFSDSRVIEEIDKSRPEILIVGMGAPLQENWISNNLDKLPNLVIIAVGEGIKVFAGIKVRGPIILRIIGLEWLIRLIVSPQKMWRRYLIGIPIFVIRIVKQKLSWVKK